MHGIAALERADLGIQGLETEIVFWAETENPQTLMITEQITMKLPDGDLRKGCIWFVDWYQAADNPNFRYEQIQCPSDI